MVLNRTSFYLSLFVLFIASCVLAGWHFDIDVLKRLLPRTISMNPVTALGFLFSAIAVLLIPPGSQNPKAWWAARLLAGVVLAIGAARLVEIAGNTSYGIDQWLYTDRLKGDMDGQAPNQIAPNTAFGFVLLGLALLLSGRSNENARRLAGIFSSLVLAVGFFTCVGYLYRAYQMYSVMKFLPMSVLTGMAFIAISLAALFLHPHTGFMQTFTGPYTGSKLVRRLIPAIVFVPVVMGFARLQLARQQPVNTELGVAALITGIVLVLFVFTWYLGNALNKADAARTGAEEELSRFNRNLEETIAERTRQLESSEQKYRHALDSMIEGVQLLDFNWRYIYVNDAVVKQSRFSRNELLGYTMMGRYPGIENTELFRILQKCMAERTSHYMENEFRYSDNEVSYFELSIHPTPEGLVILSVDISEQKRARQRILKANRLYAFISAINQSIVHINNKGELLDSTCNTAIVIGKYKLAMIAMLNESNDLQIASLRSSDDDFSNIRKYLGMNSSIPAFEHTQMGKVLYTGKYEVCNDIREGAGTDTWQQLLMNGGIRSGIAFPVTMFGKVKGVMNFYAGSAGFFDEAEINLLKEAAGDISFALEVYEKDRLRRLAEEEIKLLNNSLEEKVKQRTLELTEVNTELETYAYTVAHDLQSPLRSLNGFSSILLSDHGHKLDEDGKELLHIIKGSSLKMSELVKDLLQFSRLGKTPVSQAEINMHELLTAVLNDLNLNSNKYTTEIKIQALKPCTGDPALMKQVWANLLSNAVKYSSKKEKPMVEIGMLEGKDVYYVKDNGAGFDSQYADKLFMVFQRMHRDDEFEGTGIGLATVHRIITRHGGQVWAESKKDEGAVFYFSVPG